VTGAYRPTNPVLAGAYANTRSAVAYLDETFHRGGPGAGRFYVFSAVVVEREEMVDLRSELEAMAGGTFWHTSDELLTEDGRKKAAAMLDYLGKGPEVCVISHHVQIADDDEDLEGARRECLRGLAAKLSAGTDPVRERIDLMVLEERNPRNLSNLDHKNIAAMRREGLIHRSMQVVMTSPKFEHLLWLPDLVSAAYRRTLTHGDDTLFSLVRLMVYFVDPVE
jgi:hypothetical protein